MRNIADSVPSISSFLGYTNEVDSDIYIYIEREKQRDRDRERHVDTFHGSKGDFLVSCAVTSFKIRNHYIVANLTVVVHSAEDCCASSMRL